MHTSVPTNVNNNSSATYAFKENTVSTFNIKLLVSRVIVPSATLVRKGGIMIHETTTHEEVSNIQQAIRTQADKRAQAKAQVGRRYNAKLATLKKEVKMAVLALREAIPGALDQLIKFSKGVNIRITQRVLDLACTMLTADEISEEVRLSIKQRVWSNLYTKALGA